jgi:transcriptional regulator with XRE-family HTH domain
MKRKKAKHTLAVVRESLGLTQHEMAERLGVSENTIKSIECNSGRMNLSPPLAQRVQLETGVDAQWLLKNDAAKPIRFYLGSKWLDEKKKPQKMTMTKSRQIIVSGQKTDNLIACAIRFLHFWEAITQIIGIASNAVGQGKFSLFIYRLRRLISDLESDFGYDKKLESRLQSQIRLRESINPRSKKNVGKIVPAVLDLKPLSVAVSAIFFSKDKWTKKERERLFPAPRG